MFQLTYSVVEWWEVKKVASRVEEIGRLSYEECKAKLLGKYSPISKKDKKEKKFIDLVQGSRTVQDYMVQFERLSRFTPHIVDT